MKKLDSVTLTIYNFDNDAMMIDSGGEVSKMLRDLADRVEWHGVDQAFDDRHLIETNGNKVGRCRVFYDGDK